MSVISDLNGHVLLLATAGTDPQPGHDTEALTKSQAWQDLAQLCAAQGFSGKLLLLPGDELVTKQKAKVRHDLVGSLRTLGMALDAIRGGYRFDDDMAEAKIEAISKAIARLEPSLSAMRELLDEKDTLHGSS